MANLKEIRLIHCFGEIDAANYKINENGIGFETSKSSGCHYYSNEAL